MQVAAHTNGRDSINKFDCLLLQHILWQRPEESQRILDFLLERLAIESSTQQTDYLFDGAPPQSSVYSAEFGMRTVTDLCIASTRSLHALLYSVYCNPMGHETHAVFAEVAQCPCFDGARTFAVPAGEADTLISVFMMVA